MDVKPCNVSNTQQVAIVGIAFRLPGNMESESALWRALLEKQDLVSQVPDWRWATSELQHVKRKEPGRSITFSAGVLSRIDEFDAEFFGISPREAAMLDPQQRLLLELTWESMENAGILPSSLAGSNCAVYVGISGFDYGMRGADDFPVVTAHTMTGNTLSIAANRLSYVFDLHGPSLAVDTACSSSLVALHHACNSLRSGEASCAFVGGVNLLLHPQPFIGFTKASMLSAGGRCKSFDASGDGYVRSEGGVVLLLKPLQKALDDGDEIHAVILASGVNADGARKTGITIPSSEGQAELMLQVLARSGLCASDIDFVEAHGTGTAVGDPIEAKAIGTVYGQDRLQPLPIGSIKANLGHLEPASGLTGLLKAVLALKNQSLPPAMHLQTPNPRIDFQQLNLELVTEQKPLVRRGKKPLVAGVNSFGFGGANAHVLLQEFIPEHDQSQTKAVKGGDLPPLFLSARSDVALRVLAGRYADLLNERGASGYYDVAYAAAFQRDCMEKRLAFAPDSFSAGVGVLRSFAEGASPADVVLEEALTGCNKLAFVYSGNGAQWAGMGRLLVAESPRFAQILDELDVLMQPLTGFSVMAELMADDAACRIDDTTVAQPLLFAIQVGITTLLKEFGVEPVAVTGHSVGEIAAAWAAGALDLQQAIRVIVARSKAQGLTRGAGRMAAVGMSSHALAELLTELQAQTGEVLEVAGINSPNNSTVSGSLEGLQQLQKLIEKRGGFFRLLDLDYAFHSREMDPIAENLAQLLQGFSPQGDKKAAFVSTVTGSVLEGSALSADYWWRNVREPVRFSDAVTKLAGLGCGVYIEIGPHPILQRYISECLSAASVKGRVFATLKRQDDGLNRISEAALRVHLLSDAGIGKCYFTQGIKRTRLPNYPWQRERHWPVHSTETLLSIERRRVHPLLGWPLPESNAVWENVLDPLSMPWLADHKVGGAIVYPGAAYLEMALAAGREYFGGETLELEEFDIISPIVFDGEHGRSLRFELNTRDGGFQIRSRQRLSNDEWALNAAGRLLGEVTGYRSADMPKLEGDVRSIDKLTHYRLANLLGLDYGPAFQGLASGYQQEDRLEGRFDTERTQIGGEWLLSPAVVDTCFQSLLNLFCREIEAGYGLPLLPVKIGRLRKLGVQEVSTFRARVINRSLRSVLADFELFAADGKKVAVLEKCRFRAASIQQDLRQQPALWQILPVTQPGKMASANTVLPSVHSLVQQICQWFDEEEHRLKRESYYNEAQPLLDALASSFVYEAVKHLLINKDSLQVNAWFDGIGLLSPEHSRLVCWIRDLLVEQSSLVREENGWRLVEQGIPPSEQIWQTLLAEYPVALPELILLGRKGRALGKLLSGEVAQAVVDTEIQVSQQAEVLFDDSLTYCANREAIEHLLEVVFAHLPDNRRLRVLEISAGLSEIPLSLRNRLATGRIDYVVANGSAEICDRLQHEYQNDEWVFVAELNGVPLALQSPLALPEYFDVVVLRHVLGETGDAVLSFAKDRLASGGLLVVAGRYNDLATDLVSWGERRLSSPLSWRSSLATAGFDEVQICREPAAEGGVVGPWLLLASAGNVNQGPKVLDATRCLLLAGDRETLQLAESLRDALLARGQIVFVLDVTAQLQSQDTAAGLLTYAQQECGGLFDQIVFLPPLCEIDDTSLVAGALNLVQAIGRQENAPQLVFVTQYGAPVDGLMEGRRCNPAHAALWGIGRVVMNEYPALGCRLLDIAVKGAEWAESLLEPLADELLYSDGENEVVLDADRRHVLRMQRANLTDYGNRPNDSKNFRLDFIVPGQLRNLLWLEQPQREPGPDEVEVKPLATGLNFRDVMYVMGLLPDEAVEKGFAGASLGLEFAGVVTRVGHRVDEFAPGDAVMGFGSACFSSHVLTRASALAVKPDTWSFEAAATVPTVFFTVYYALRHLADLQPGERVLIHGAAGGVGIAAVQLARYLGAEVFATAGSDEKREFVSLLGADHVFDSRSLAFADQILAATDGQGVDIVLNSLAGEAIRRNLKILKPFGRFLELGKRDFFENTPVGLRPFKDNISYFGIDADQLLIARPELASRLFREVMGLFRSGALAPLPARVFSAERIVDAFRYMQQARQIGKVVVSFEGADIRPQNAQFIPSVFSVSPNSAYLVTGGLSGFGLETARWLAKSGAQQLVLLGRRGDATPGAESAISSLRSLGADVVVLACDVADRESLAAALKYPGLLPLKGIFHAAMVIDDALIANLEPERVLQVLAPKVKGAWNLHNLTADLPLDFFMLYSSITTYIGNPGQANYVAANSWLEGLAVLRRSLGLPVTCIGWGPIGDAGYLTRNESVKDSLASRLGAEALSSQLALDALGNILQKPCPNVAIGDFHFSALARLLPSAQGPRFTSLRRYADEVSDGGDSLEDFKTMIQGKSESEILSLVARLVTQEVAQILAVSPERIDPVRSLHDLGLDSLMGVELALGLEKRFGVQIPAMLLNEGPTIERVSARIVERLLSVDNTADQPASDIANLAIGLAAQHGEAVSQDLLEAVLTDATSTGAKND